MEYPRQQRTRLIWKVFVKDDIMLSKAIERKKKRIWGLSSQVFNWRITSSATQLQAHCLGNKCGWFNTNSFTCCPWQDVEVSMDLVARAQSWAGEKHPQSLSAAGLGLVCAGGEGTENRATHLFRREIAQLSSSVLPEAVVLRNPLQTGHTGLRKREARAQHTFVQSSCPTEKFAPCLT